MNSYSGTKLTTAVFTVRRSAVLPQWTREKKNENTIKTNLLIMLRAFFISCSARWYSDASMEHCSNVTDMPVLSLALLHDVNLIPERSAINYLLIKYCLN